LHFFSEKSGAEEFRVSKAAIRFGYNPAKEKAFGTRQIRSGAAEWSC
jgi:hypothetical protein